MKGCVAVILLVATAAVATASSSGLRVFGRESASGDYAIAIATGGVKRPKQLFVRVLASPRQRVDGNWTMVCSKGLGAGSKTGRFRGRSPLTRAMRFPMRRPDDCSVSAAGALTSGSGRITVLLLKRVP